MSRTILQFLFAENVVVRTAGKPEQRLSFSVAVENVAYDKRVEIHWTGEDGVWRVLPAHYVRTCGSREVWETEATFRESEGNDPLPGDVEFAVRYRSGGRDWWDNNNDQNHRIACDSGILLSPELHVVNVRPEPRIHRNHTHYVVTAAVRDGPAEAVHVLWSADGWQSAHTTPCAYRPEYWEVSHDSSAPNPNRYGTTVYVGQIHVEHVSRLEYAVALKRDGVVAWDNNHGANYTATRDRLRVLTLNLHCFQEDDHDAKLAQIAGVIDELQVDIVCLQEVGEPWNDGYGERGSNAARIIRDRVKDRYFLAADWSHLGFGKYREGSAILSRYGFTSKDSIYVSATQDPYDIHSRRVVMAQIQVPYYGAINVYSVHLSWWSDGFRTQFENLRRWAQEKHTPNVAATLLCGDFNAEPSSEGYRMVTIGGEFVDQHLSAVRRNAGGAAALPPGDDRRIDYIFLNQGAGLQAVASRVLFTPADYGRVSDHPGYYVEFELGD